MENNTGFDMDANYLDDEIMFHEIVMEYTAREQEEKLRSRDDGWGLPDVMTEEAYRILMEMIGEE